eukprot:CAMPEP_0175331194 /NCGR_PEP_ID=MMETSP0095-20121207/1117_1 /TAXON_ID=311494 /ORGANISM="Alexandrium monilatum, Strain CCMP3105" /LENGTH=30 /DNA_ID= /DNA_START= /DNA_END= /DNA_ORIENTATION=
MPSACAASARPQSPPTVRDPRLQCMYTQSA